MGKKNNKCEVCGKKIKWKEKLCQDCEKDNKISLYLLYRYLTDVEKVPSDYDY
jgi:predicted amidophosphoribosyltransferase